MADQFQGTITPTGVGGAGSLANSVEQTQTANVWKTALGLTDQVVDVVTKVSDVVVKQNALDAKAAADAKEKLDKQKEDDRKDRDTIRGQIDAERFNVDNGVVGDEEKNAEAYNKKIDEIYNGTSTETAEHQKAFLEGTKGRALSENIDANNTKQNRAISNNAAVLAINVHATGDMEATISEMATKLGAPEVKIRDSLMMNVAAKTKNSYSNATTPQELALIDADYAADNAKLNTSKLAGTQSKNYFSDMLEKHKGEISSARADAERRIIIGAENRILAANNEFDEEPLNQWNQGLNPDMVSDLQIKYKIGTKEENRAGYDAESGKITKNHKLSNEARKAVANYNPDKGMSYGEKDIYKDNEIAKKIIEKRASDYVEFSARNGQWDAIIRADNNLPGAAKRFFDNTVEEYGRTQDTGAASKSFKTIKAINDKVGGPTLIEHMIGTAKYKEMETLDTMTAVLGIDINKARANLETAKSHVAIPYTKDINEYLQKSIEASGTNGYKLKEMVDAMQQISPSSVSVKSIKEYKEKIASMSTSVMHDQTMGIINGKKITLNEFGAKLNVSLLISESSPEDVKGEFLSRLGSIHPEFSELIVRPGNIVVGKDAYGMMNRNVIDVNKVISDENKLFENKANLDRVNKGFIVKGFEKGVASSENFIIKAFHSVADFDASKDPRSLYSAYKRHLKATEKPDMATEKQFNMAYSNQMRREIASKEKIDTYLKSGDYALMGEFQARQEKALEHGNIQETDRLRKNYIEHDKKINKDEMLSNLHNQEGGFQISEHDEGNYVNGELLGTNHGVSAKTYARVLGRTPTVEDMKGMTKKTAEDILWKGYYVGYGLDKVGDVGLKNILFSGFVNAPLATIKAIQFTHNIEVDGNLNSRTKKAIQNMSAIDRDNLPKQIYKYIEQQNMHGSDKDKENWAKNKAGIKKRYDDLGAKWKLEIFNK